MSMQRECALLNTGLGKLSDEADLFRVLGDPNRLIIMSMLIRTNGELCVCDFLPALPLRQPTVSHHLRVLRESGLVQDCRRGTWVYYSLDPRFGERLRGAVETLLQPAAPLNLISI